MDPVDDLLPLTPVVYQTLVALANGSRHGYAIAREVESVTEGRIRMGPGTLYGSLQRMVKQELVTPTDPGAVDGSHAQRRRYYALTELGARVLAEETRRLEAAVRLARSRIAEDAL